jgi:hypothetical protein
MDSMWIFLSVEANTSLVSRRIVGEWEISQGHSLLYPFGSGEALLSSFAY